MYTIDQLYVKVLSEHLFCLQLIEHHILKPYKLIVRHVKAGHIASNNII